MDQLNGKLRCGALLLFALIGESLNIVIKPRDLTLGTENRNWMNADKACQTDGLQLLSSITEENMVDIVTLMTLWKDDGVLLSSVWVGMNRHVGELGFKWDSCSDVIQDSNLPWMSGQPQLNTGDSCVIIDKLSWKLKSTSCYSQYQYICEKPRDKCWFDMHILKQSTDAKMNIGSYNLEECKDQCRRFILGSQECVLIELRESDCYIVKSDIEYIDETPAFTTATSSYPIIGVKRCLARSYRQSTMTHISFYSLPPRNPCPSSSSTSRLPSSEFYSYSRTTSVSLVMDASSFPESSSGNDINIYSSSIDIYSSSTASNVLSSSESMEYTTEQSYQTQVSTDVNYLNSESELSTHTINNAITVSWISTNNECNTTIPLMTSLQSSEGAPETSTSSVVLSTNGIMESSSMLFISTPIVTETDAPKPSTSSVVPPTNDIMESSSMLFISTATITSSVVLSTNGIMESSSMLFMSTPIATETDIVLSSVTSSIAYQPIYPRTNVKFNALCRCICMNNDSSVNGISETKVAEIRKKLFVDTSTLSSTRRKLTSAEDYRPSAIMTGQFGLVVLILVFCFFLILDAQRFIVAIFQFMKKKFIKKVTP